MLHLWELTGLKFGLWHSRTAAQICRTWGKCAWRPSDPMSKHLKVRNQTNELLNKRGPFHLPWTQWSGGPSTGLDGWGCISHWNVVVCGERQPVGQPNPPLLRSGPVLNQDLLADPNPHSTPLQMAAPWPLLRLERLPPARLTALTAKAFQKAWEALGAGLVQIYGPWYSEGQGRLWVGKFFALRNYHVVRGRMGRPY